MNLEEVYKKIVEVEKLLRESLNILKKIEPQTERYYAVKDLLNDIVYAKALFEEEEVEEEEEEIF